MKYLILVVFVVAATSAHNNGGYGANKAVYNSLNNGAYQLNVVYESKKADDTINKGHTATANNLGKLNGAIFQQKSTLSQPSRALTGYQPQPQYSYEVIFDSQRQGWNHPWVVYDSNRDGLNAALRFQFNNHPNLITIFDSKVDSWNHPWVIYDSRRDGKQ